MQYEPALVMAIALPVAFSWRTFWEVYSIEVEIFETGEGEAEEGAGGDEEEREVVAFAEAQWVVDFARESDKGIWRLWGWSEGCHLVDWRWCCRRLEGRRCGMHQTVTMGNTRRKISMLRSTSDAPDYCLINVG